MNKVTVITIILLFLVSNSLFSQMDTSTDVVKRYQFDYSDLKVKDKDSKNEVISASRSSKRIEDLPVTVFVVTHEEIQKCGYVTLVDVLKSLPAIRVSQPGSGELGEMFTLRGMLGNYYTKILINDVPIQPSVVAGMPIGAQIPIRQAERIEVLYGPSSSVYGADAMAGVINIITRKPEKNAFADADVTIGNNGYSTINFMAGGKSGKNKRIFNYTFYGSRTEFKDMNIIDEMAFSPLDMLQFYYDTIPYLNIPSSEFKPSMLSNFGITNEEFIQVFYPQNYEGSIFMPDVSNISNASHSLGFQFGFKNLSFSYDNLYRRDHSSIGMNSYLYKFNNPMNYYGENIQRWILKFEKDFPRFSNSSRLSYLKYTMDENSSSAPTYISDVLFWYVYSASDDIAFDEVVTVPINDNIEILGGFTCQVSGNLPITNGSYAPFNPDDYKIFRESVNLDDTLYGQFGINPVIFHNLAGYGQVSFNYNKFSLLAGLRYDRNSFYGGSTNPRIALLYKFSDKQIIRLSYGSSFKAPAMNIAYYSVAFPNNLFPDKIEYAFIPNKNLSPEKFQSYELGFRQKLFNFLEIDISTYYHEIFDLITTGATVLDTNEYLNAYIGFHGSDVRTNLNATGAKSKLFGIQSNIKALNILPEIALDLELNLSLSKGSEILPNKDKIDFYRGMPFFIGQYNIAMSPTPKLRIKVFATLMTDCYRRYIPDKEFAKQDYAKEKGFRTMDIVANYSLNSQFGLNFKVLNVFDKIYGGLDATGTDIDMRFNPQYRRNFRFGLIYNFN